MKVQIELDELNKLKERVKPFDKNEVGSAKYRLMRRWLSKKYPKIMQEFYELKVELMTAEEANKLSLKYL